MEPRDLLRVITRRLWVIVAAGLVGLAVATAAVLTSPSVYEATSRVFVSTKQATSLSDVNQGSAFTQQIVKSYAEVTTSPLVLDPVIRQLRLGDTEQELAKRVSATAALDTVIIDVSVDDRDPTRARRIADAITQRLSTVVDDLTTVRADAAAVAITRIQPATLAAGRVSPQPSVLLPIGALVGLLVGLLGVLVIAAATRRVHSVRDAQRATDLPVLAGLPRRSSALAAKPVTAGALGADGYRALRASIGALTGLSRSRSIVVTGSEPRAGTTTTAVNLAIALAEGGASVALVEANLRTPSLSTFLDLPTEAGLDDVLTGAVDLDDAMTSWGDHGLTVLVASAMPGGGADLLAGTAMHEVMDRLAARFEVVVYDAPDLLGSSDAATLAARVDGAVVITRAGRTRSGVLRDGLDDITVLGGAPFGVVVTRLPRRGADAPRITT